MPTARSMRGSATSLTLRRRAAGRRAAHPRRASGRRLRRQGARRSAQIVGDVAPEALNLVLLMVRRGRPRAIGRMVEHFRELLRRHRGISLAEVRTALPLDETQRVAVIDRLHELTGDEIEINEVVDESLIGGITVRIGDRALRRQRAQPPGAAAGAADRRLGDREEDEEQTPMAIRSDEITSIIRSEIKGFDAGADVSRRRHHRRGGRRHRPGLRPVRRPGAGAARLRQRDHGHGLQPRGGDGRRPHPGRLHLPQGGRPGQDDRPHRRGAGRRRPHRPRREPARRADRRQGPDRDDHDPARSSASRRASSSASRSTRRSRPASRPSTR